MNSSPGNIVLQIPATPELVELVKVLLSNGAGISYASPNNNADEMITLRQGASECGCSYDAVRKWVVDEQRIKFTRPSGAPKGKIFIRRGDLQALIKTPDQVCENSNKLGRPRLPTRVNIL